MAELFAEGRIRPVVTTLPLSAATEAHRRLEALQVIDKLMLAPSGRQAVPQCHPDLRPSSPARLGAPFGALTPGQSRWRQPPVRRHLTGQVESPLPARYKRIVHRTPGFVATVPSMHLRLEQGGDKGGIRALHLAAFGDDGEVVARLVDGLRLAVTVDNGLSLVAEQPGHRTRGVHA